MEGIKVRRRRRWRGLLQVRFLSLWVQVQVQVQVPFFCVLYCTLILDNFTYTAGDCAASLPPSHVLPGSPFFFFWTDYPKYPRALASSHVERATSRSCRWHQPDSGKSTEALPPLQTTLSTFLPLLLPAVIPLWPLVPYHSAAPQGVPHRHLHLHHMLLPTPPFFVYVRSREERRTLLLSCLVLLLRRPPVVDRLCLHSSASRPPVVAPKINILLHPVVQVSRSGASSEPRGTMV